MSRSARQILVIDDSAVLLVRIKRALSLEGYNVITTTQAVGNGRYLPKCDLVIIDFHMPGIDGEVALASLKSIASTMPNPVPFYLYTSDPAVMGRYAELGFDGVFSDKGNETLLVSQVRAAFRMVDMQRLRSR